MCGGIFQSKILLLDKIRLVDGDSLCRSFIKIHLVDFDKTFLLHASFDKSDHSLNTPVVVAL